MLQLLKETVTSRHAERLEQIVIALIGVEIGASFSPRASTIDTVRKLSDLLQLSALSRSSSTSSRKRGSPTLSRRRPAGQHATQTRTLIAHNARSHAHALYCTHHTWDLSITEPWTLNCILHIRISLTMFACKSTLLTRPPSPPLSIRLSSFCPSRPVR